MCEKLFNPLLFGAAALFAACSGSEDITVETPPPNEVQEWTARVYAENDSIDNVDNTQVDAVTRAIFIGGNNGNRFAKAWDSGDIVYAYKEDSPVGSLNPRQGDWGYASATLEGTLTGPFAVNDVLSLYSPSRIIDLTGQTGSIQSMSGKTYRQTTTTVTEAADNILSLSAVSMSHRVGYARFYLTDEDGGARLHPSQLVIHSISGPDIVLKTDENGTPTETGDMVINAEMYEGEYPAEPYVALYCDYDASFSYTLKATVGENVYVGPLAIDGQNAITTLPGNGGFMNYRRKMRLTTAASTLTVDAITDQTFTGSAIEPVVTVRDGETVLTQGTDYSVAYSDNTAGGTATVTITGLADAGATAATKYLGTKEVNFTIGKATPVITMAESTLTLIASEGEGHTGSVAVSSIMVGELDVSEWVDISYSSSNASIASVADDGTVTGAGHGNATITVTATPKTAYAGNINAATTTFNVVVSEKAGVSSTIGSWGDGGTENPDVKF